MPRRQPLPRLWLMTDERLGDGLLAALARLPAGAGIVFRHYSLAEAERRALFDRVAASARRRRPAAARRPGRAGAQPGAPTAATAAGRGRGLQERAGPRSRARSAPPSATAPTCSSSRRSSRRAAIPAREPLGLARFAWLARRTRAAGDRARRHERGARAQARRVGAYGWAGIDAWAGSA